MDKKDVLFIDWYIHNTLQHRKTVTMLQEVFYQFQSWITDFFIGIVISVIFLSYQFINFIKNKGGNIYE